MTYQRRKCPVADCSATPREDGPEFCEAHWQQLPKARRKFISDEYAAGERWGWARWKRQSYDAIVATAIKSIGENDHD